jgi:hypothetical protein
MDLKKHFFLKSVAYVFQILIFIAKKWGMAYKEFKSAKYL